MSSGFLARAAKAGLVDEACRLKFKVRIQFLEIFMPFLGTKAN